eukprot:g4655.t1
MRTASTPTTGDVSTKQVIDALLREYMKRENMGEALQCFDAENPRDDASISQMSALVRALGLSKQYKSNKLRDTPLGSVLELVWDEFGGDLAGSNAARGVAAAGPEVVNVEAAAAEYYQRLKLGQKAASNGSPAQAAGASSLRSGARVSMAPAGARASAAANISSKVSTQSPTSGSTPKREWAFDAAKPAKELRELSPSSYGRAPKPVQRAPTPRAAGTPGVASANAGMPPRSSWLAPRASPRPRPTSTPSLAPLRPASTPAPMPAPVPALVRPEGQARAGAGAGPPAGAAAAGPEPDLLAEAEELLNAVAPGDDDVYSFD